MTELQNRVLTPKNRMLYGKIMTELQNRVSTPKNRMLCRYFLSILVLAIMLCHKNVIKDDLVSSMAPYSQISGKCIQIGTKGRQAHMRPPFCRLARFSDFPFLIKAKASSKLSITNRKS